MLKSLQNKDLRNIWQDICPCFFDITCFFLSAHCNYFVCRSKVLSVIRGDYLHGFSQTAFLGLISAGRGDLGALVVDEKVAQGIYGVVVDAVFLRQFATGRAFRVMVAAHCLDQTPASR